MTEDKTARDKKIDTIAALLAKAHDPAVTEEEAQAYLGKAAALMQKYSIEEEEARRANAKLNNEALQDETIKTFNFDIITKGGHGMHRMMAFNNVVIAMGGRAFMTTGAGTGYNVKTTLHISAHVSTLEHLKVFLPAMSMAMETLANKESRRVSRQARLNGGHHSLEGCRARRGFMAGFGNGIAERVRGTKMEMVDQDLTGGTALVLKDRASQLDTYMERFGEMKDTSAQRFSVEGFNRGREAGRAFASPGIGGQRTAIEA